MSNIDLKKDMKQLYTAPKNKVTVVEVPMLNYLMIDGYGDPNTSQLYKDSVSALYNLAYGIRAISKAAGTVFTVMPLQGLWDLPLAALANFDKSQFTWTMMILQPEHIATEMVAEARDIVRKKKNPARLDDIRFEAFNEGNCVQILHVGAYADEKPTVDQLHQYMEVEGFKRNGLHHEIYLSNPDRVAPEKLKTIIRQPVR